MNPEAILTPGGIADQLTRGLSGLGQSFARRNELLYQGQRDRIADDRYNAEMALRREALARQTARQALEDQRYAEEQAYRKQAAADALRKREQDRVREDQRWMLSRGVVPQGVAEYRPASAAETFGRFGPNDVPEGYSGEYTPEGQIAANARQSLRAPAEPRDYMTELQTKLNAQRERDRLKNEAGSAREALRNKLTAINSEIKALEAAQSKTAPISEKDVKSINWWPDRNYTKEEVAADPQNIAYNNYETQLKALRSARDALLGLESAPTSTPQVSTGTDDWGSDIDPRQFIRN